MTEDPDPPAWQTTTDRTRIERWADEHGAVPVQREGSTGDLAVDVTQEPLGGDEERITWDRFFERFDAEGLAFRYRDEPTPDPDDVACELVDREDGLDRLEDDGVDQEMVATSDTGEGEPPVPEGSGGGSEESEIPSSPGETKGRATESGRRTLESEGGPAESEERPSEPGERPAESPGSDEESAMSETARGSETPALVLDEIYEDPGLMDSRLEEEYVAFRNEGESPIDLSGWRVENDAGQSYVFPEGVVLDPGSKLTLHSGDGTDTDSDQYWDASDPVWDERGGTVTVTTDDGRRVVREPYKA